MQQTGFDYQTTSLIRPYDGPSGIGGWLIFAVLGLVSTILRTLTVVTRDLLPFVDESVWASLADPNNPVYHPWLRSTIALEIAGQHLLLIGAIILLVQLARKRSTFPMMMIAFVAFHAIFVLVDAALVRRIPALATAITLRWEINVWTSLIDACIWIPYLLLSRRVSNTFTR